ERGLVAGGATEDVRRARDRVGAGELLPDALNLDLGAGLDLRVAAGDAVGLEERVAHPVQRGLGERVRLAVVGRDAVGDRGRPAAEVAGDLRALNARLR